MSMPVCIVGGGWSGLACAVHLAHHGIPVQILEAAPQLGGRARAVPGFDQALDNGQHLFIGGYHHLRHLLDLLKQNTDHYFEKQTCHWQVLEDHKNFSLKLPKLKTPFHGLVGTVLAQGLSWKEKWQLMRFCHALQKPMTQDCTVSSFLAQAKLSPNLIKQLFEPLCLAALSTPADKASSHVFVHVLRDAFFKQSSDSDFWFAKTCLSSLLPSPAQKYLEQLGNTVQINTRVESLIVENNIVKGVRTKHHFIAAPAVVLATPYWSTAKLTRPHQALKKITEACEHLQSESITTVYCQYEQHVRLPQRMIGLNGTLSQWVFDRRFANQPGLLAVVITGVGPHMSMSHQQLASKVQQELKRFFPQCNTVLNTRVIHEKRGAFSCTVEHQKLRPDLLTPVEQLYLAGDYCKNPYPATLEGAVLNGQRCAQEVLKRLNYDNTSRMSISA